MSQHLPIEETDLFRKIEALADEIWNLVDTWKSSRQETIGRRLVRAADSIGTNLVEGDGRYSDADALHFVVISRASARETGYWLRSAKRRNLIPAQTADSLVQQLEFVLKSLDGLINYRRNGGRLVREDAGPYDGIDRADQRLADFQLSTLNTQHSMPPIENDARAPRVTGSLSPLNPNTDIRQGRH